ncbi:MAG: hypothetical protein CM1200mP29_09400 [Verrucomicrobiota bacterium]|nr:MAG: hypothetical protein CM1200mP29_09400 [Verrucomicrobiota bacterium]
MGEVRHEDERPSQPRPDSRAAIPYLVGRLASGDPAKRSQAINPLGRIGPDAKEAVPRLITHLEPKRREREKGGQPASDSRNRQRSRAGNFGVGQATTSGPKLSDNTWQGPQSPEEIGPQAAPALAAALKPKQADGIVYFALLGLKNIRAKSPTVRQAILPFLEYEKAAFRGMALAALVALPTSRPA